MEARQGNQQEKTNLFRADVAWFKKHLGWDVSDVQEVLFYSKGDVIRVWRVELQSNNPTVPQRVIVKQTVPPNTVAERKNAEDPHEYVREYYAYKLLPALGVPTAQIFFSAINLSTEENLLVMEDLTLKGRVNESDHRWQIDEVKCVLNTYVKLHAAGLREAEKGDLLKRWLWLQAWDHVDRHEACRIVDALLSSPFTSGRLSRHVATLKAICDCVDPLRGYVAAQPQTFNYCDFFPGNVAIPKVPTPDGIAILFDWHLLGVGMPQSDLLNVFCGGDYSDVDLDECVKHYITRFNAAANTSFTQDWVEDGITAAKMSDLLFHLWVLKYRLLRLEEKQEKLPMWLEGAIRGIENGAAAKLAEEVNSLLRRK